MLTKLLLFRQKKTTLQLLSNGVKFTLMAQLEAILSKIYLVGSSA